MRRISRILTMAAFGSVGLLAAACAGDSSTAVAGNSSAQLAFNTTSSSASFEAVPVTSGGHTLDLTAVTLTVARAELKRASSDNCPGDDEEDDDHPQAAPSTSACGELEIGPITVSLPLDTTLVTLPANAVPAGTFREFELRVSRVEIKGTFDGKAFDDTIAVKAKSEVQFATPLVVTAATPTSITVNVPIKKWLVNTDGSLIDPTKLSTNPSLLALVKAHIVASFRAFEDENHDGRDDHEESGGHD